MNVKFKPLKEHNVKEVKDLFNRIYHDYYWPIHHTEQSLAQLINYMNINEDISMIMYQNNEAIGLALVAKRQKDAWLYTIGVLSTKRGKGYGEAILVKALHECSRFGVENLGLEVLLQNHKARKLYYKLGFKRHCYLDSYSTMQAFKPLNTTKYEYKHLTQEEAQLVINDPISLVWSRRKDTLLQRDINWLAAFKLNKLMSVIVYDNAKSLSFYRFLTFDKEHMEESLRNLIARIQQENPHCSRKVAININHNYQNEQEIVKALGLNRFMRQEYLNIHL